MYDLMIGSCLCIDETRLPGSMVHDSVVGGPWDTISAAEIKLIVVSRKAKKVRAFFFLCLAEFFLV
jgi:hypothetical protein